MQKLAKNVRIIYGTKSKHNPRKPMQVLDSASQAWQDLEGRRIIHLKTFSSQMFCTKCNSSLKLNNLIEEEKHGLASIFWIQCASCDFVNKVNTDKQHKSAVTGMTVFDVNTKAALG